MTSWLPRAGGGNPPPQQPYERLPAAAAPQARPLAEKQPVRAGQFTVVKNNYPEIVRANKAITEGRDFSAGFALVNGTHVINVQPLNEGIYKADAQLARLQQPERPLVGLGGFLRDYLNVQPFEEAILKMEPGRPMRSYEQPFQMDMEPYDPRARDEYVIGINVEITWHSLKIAAQYANKPPPEMDQDELEEFFRKVRAC